MRIVSSACAPAPPTGPSAMATSIVNCRAVPDCIRWYIFLAPHQNAKLSCANCRRARRSRKSCSAQTKLGICPNSSHLAGPTKDPTHDGIDRPAHQRRRNDHGTQHHSPSTTALCPQAKGSRGQQPQLTPPPLVALSTCC